MQTEKKWYAVIVKKHSGKKVMEGLKRKRIEHYCPLNKITRHLEYKNYPLFFVPLFEDLIFVHVAEQEVYQVNHIDGVLHFLYWLSDLAVISKEDIHTIRVFVNLYPDVMIEKVVDFSSATKDPSDIEYQKNQGSDKIFLPTLRYFLLAATQQEIKKEIFTHAV